MPCTMGTSRSRAKSAESPKEAVAGELGIGVASVYRIARASRAAVYDSTLDPREGAETGVGGLV